MGKGECCTRDRYIWVLKVLKEADSHRMFLSEFEEAIVTDRILSVRKYGRKVVITDKQFEVFQEIAEKLGLSPE